MRTLRRSAVAAVLAAVAGLLQLPAGPAPAGAASVCDVRDPVAIALRDKGLFDHSLEPDAGRWKTWNAGIGEVAIGAPPATGSPGNLVEIAELHQAQATRTPDAVTFARQWGSGAAGSPWTAELLRMIKKYSATAGRNPPRFSRQIAIFETGLFDALAAVWNAKYCYYRPAPSQLDPLLSPAVAVPDAPSYPSEHAAAAGAASVLLRDFFPEEAGIEDLAWSAAASRITAGANYRSDVSAGFAAGRAVAKKVLAARANDGSTATWDGTGRIEGRCNWSPTPPAFAAPAEPAWGKVRPFLMSAGSQFRPGPPPACDSDEYIAAAEDLYEASLTLSDRQKEIALYWAGGPGTETPPGMNLRSAMEMADRYELNTMRHARVLAHVGAAIADAGIAAWDAKFTYWWDRPVQTIRRKWDPSWTSFIGTPPFPGYISGHSTFSAAAMETLASFFPREATVCRALATEAAVSRFYGGIHSRYDNEVGLDVGGRIGALAAARAASDGA